jgi:hypothetical protein
MRLPDYPWEHPQESDYEEARVSDTDRDRVAEIYGDEEADRWQKLTARIASLEAERDKLKAEMVDMTTDRDRWQTAYNDVCDQLRAYKCTE